MCALMRWGAQHVRTYAHLAVPGAESEPVFLHADGGERDGWTDVGEQWGREAAAAALSANWRRQWSRHTAVTAG